MTQPSAQAADGRAEALLRLALADKGLDELLADAVSLAEVLFPGAEVSYDAVSSASTDGTTVPVLGDGGNPLGYLRIRGPELDRDSQQFVRRLADVLGTSVSRRRREDEVQRSERRLVEAQRISHVGSYDFEIASNTNVWSDQLFRIYGREPQSFQPSYEVFLSMLVPEDREHVLAVHQGSLATLEPFEMEERIVWPDGQVRTLASWGEVVADGAGTPVRMVGICWDITERRAIEEQLVQEGLQDRLTGLPNRALFGDRLAQALGGLSRRTGSVGVLFLDVDRFKVINDSLGHEAGDDVILELGRRLSALMRPGDTVARFGGDEFIVLCEGIEHPAEAMHFAQRLQEGISAPVLTQGSEVVVTVSIGIALTTSADDLPGGLLRDADAAMYRAKRDGRARAVLFADGMRAEALARLDTEVDLRRALSTGDLRLHYQPVVDLASRRIVGVEALLRWQHPTRGLVMPGEVIPIAEETGLIVPLGEWVLEEACRQLVAWHAHSPDLTMAVNLSGIQMTRPDFVERMATIVADSGVQRSALSLEITETVLMRDAAQALSVLQSLKGLGVRISVDDFGTGYSSLSYLKRFPVDVLKIDRTFVDGLGSDTEDTAIVQAILALAASLGMTTVAEGVETQAQLAGLQQLGCTTAQGYLLGRPVPAADIDALLGHSGG